MITPEKYLAAVHNEYRIIRHLAEKIPHDAHGYRPSDKQRSTVELLGYLTVIGSSMMHSLLNNGAWPDYYTELMNSVTIDNFAERLNDEENRIKENFAKFTPEMMDEKIDLFGMGHAETVADYLMDLIQILSAYKMQLFLYIKASGVTNIGTSNAWGGMDMNA